MAHDDDWSGTVIRADRALWKELNVGDRLVKDAEQEVRRA